MTRDDYAKLSEEVVRIKIAKAHGWSHSSVLLKNTLIEGWVHPTEGGFCGGEALDVLPDYSTDLNAIHKAEMSLTNVCLMAFRKQLAEITTDGTSGYGKRMCHATAAQRAEAFVLTMES